MRPSVLARAVRPALLTACAAAVVALGFELINGFPHGLTYDDAYFYAQIAYNLGEHGRSSFDGAATTSGYHLLWGGLLGAVSGALSTITPDRIVHLYVHEVLFVALGLYVAVAFYGRWLERFCVLVLVVMGTLLMETVLLSLLLLVLARAETSETETGGGLPRAAAMAFVVPFARIDAALIVAIYAALVLVEGDRRRGTAIGLAVALGALAQMGAMLALFGEPFSVSSEIKAANAVPFGAAMGASVMGPDGIALGYVVRFALFVGLAAAAIGAGIAGRASAANRRLLYLSLGAAAFSGGHVVSHMVPFWCYLPAYLVHVYALTHTRLDASILQRARSLVVLGIAAVGLAFLTHKVVLFSTNREVIQGARAFVDALPRQVPPGQRIYQVDGSGFTGFFSGRGVVNGDGLVNTYEYARRARRNDLAGYLDERGICFIVTNTAASGDALVDHGGLRVTRSEVDEVLRSPTYGAFGTTDFVLYRRRTPGCAA